MRIQEYSTMNDNFFQLWTFSTLLATAQGSCCSKEEGLAEENPRRLNCFDMKIDLVFTLVNKIASEV